LKLYSESNSQAGQESYVLNVLNEKRGGVYVEIGAFDAYRYSNTSLLENGFSWQGIAIEIDKKYTKKYNKARRNKCINADAITFNYRDLFAKRQYPSTIDYLQVDIEPAGNTLNALLALPHNSYQFRVITFEHDLYATPDNIQIKDCAHEFLKGLGYFRTVSNILNLGNAFEDWYVHPTHVDDLWVKEVAINVEWTELFARS
jgi:hypothetical protein